MARETIRELEEMIHNLQDAKDQDEKQRLRTISELTEALKKKESTIDKLLERLVKIELQALELSFITLGYKKIFIEAGLVVTLEDFEEDTKTKK